MRNKILTQVGIVILGSALFMGCNPKIERMDSSAEKVEEAQKDVVDAKQELNLAIAEFQKESTELILANEKRIAEIKLEIAKESMDNRNDIQQELAKIEEKNSQLKKKLSGYKNDGSQKWDAFKDEFNHDIEELGKAFSNLTVSNTQ